LAWDPLFWDPKLNMGAAVVSFAGLALFCDPKLKAPVDAEALPKMLDCAGLTSSGFLSAGVDAPNWNDGAAVEVLLANILVDAATLGLGAGEPNKVDELPMTDDVPWDGAGWEDPNDIFSDPCLSADGLALPNMPVARLIGLPSKLSGPRFGVDESAVLL
jgi:hypothetical protein